MSDLTFQDVLNILHLIDAGPFAECEIEFEGTRVKVTRRPDGASASAMSAAAAVSVPTAPAQPASPAHPAPAIPSAAAQAHAAPQAEPRPATTGAAVDVPNRVEVKSPMAGTFYRSPSPGAPPFVETDRAVRKGDQLGIVEVMKLFTPVVSPCDATVRAILVRNEQFVESDQALMILEGAQP